MAKYSYEFKKKVVDAYLNDEDGYIYLAETYGIAAWSNIKKWVNDFRIAGPDALRPKKKGRKTT